MAQPQGRLAPLELRGWKNALSWAGAVLLCILFAASGVWKITDAPGWAQRIHELKVSETVSTAAAVALGIAETLAAVLVLVPRFRRWGAILAGLLLVVFMAYFAIHYSELRGADCSCFPWVKRVVGPEFFIADGLMLLLAVFAGIWSRPPESVRSAAVVLGTVVVFAMVSFGVDRVRQTGPRAPETITVNGQAFSLGRGKFFLYFFDPECMHCVDAAKRMSHLHWGDTQVVAVPIQAQQYAAAFLQETGLRAVISNDLDKLKQAFPFAGVPAGVAIEGGREKAALTRFEDPEPETTLKKLELVY